MLHSVDVGFAEVSQGALDQSLEPAVLVQAVLSGQASRPRALARAAPDRRDGAGACDAPAAGHGGSLTTGPLTFKGLIEELPGDSSQRPVAGAFT